MLKIQNLVVFILISFSGFYCDPASATKKSNSADKLIPIALLGSMSSFSDDIPYATCEGSVEFGLAKPLVDDISSYTVKFYKYKALDDESTAFTVSSVKGQASAYTCVLAFQENIIVDTDSDVDTIASGQSTSSCQTYTKVSSKKGSYRCVAVLGATSGKFSLTATASPPSGTTTNKIFVTTNTNGNLGGLSGADYRCNTDFYAPSSYDTNPSVYYKALLYGNNALKANTSYYTPFENLIGKTDSSGNLPSTLSYAISYGSTYSIWTGDATNNCNSWTSTSGYSGVTGLASSTSSTFLNNSSALCDNNTNRLYCVQQTATGKGATISSFSPTSGPLGSTITINGTGFSTTLTNNTVMVNGIAATVNSATTTQLVATIQANAAIPPNSTSILYVVVDDLVAKPRNYPYNFTLTNTIISSVSPSSGFTGSSVMISGSNFISGNANNVVRFNGTVATVTSSNPYTLMVTVPAGATPGNITVTNSNGTATSPSSFVVIDTNYTPTYDFTSGLPGGWTGTNAWTVNTTPCPASGSGNCLRSAIIGDSSSSVIQFTASVNAGYVIFRRKVSSEYGVDSCVFKIDGASTEGSGVNGVADSIYAFPVSTGTHTFSWTYAKDFSVSQGSDSCSIDNVFIP